MPNKCGEYICQCQAKGWMTPTNGLTCQRCHDPCANGDPCNALLDQGNKCVQTFSSNRRGGGGEVMCGSYVCQCGGGGFLATQDSSSCTRCTDTCANSDPCFTRNNPNNRCLPASGGICGLYTCQCQEPGWMTPMDAKTCQECVNPCLTGDPCLSAENPSNVCLQLPGTCGQHICQCGAPGWLTPREGKTCQRCEDPCPANDPCKATSDNRNRCVPVYEFEYGVVSGTHGAHTRCGSYVCQCGADGFLQSSDSQACTSCADSCSMGDPCFAKNNPGNTCMRALGGICGLYTCQCNAKGWLTPIGGKTCQGKH